MRRFSWPREISAGMRPARQAHSFVPDPAASCLRVIHNAGIIPFLTKRTPTNRFHACVQRTHSRRPRFIDVAHACVDSRVPAYPSGIDVPASTGIHAVFDVLSLCSKPRISGLGDSQAGLGEVALLPQWKGLLHPL